MDGKTKKILNYLKKNGGEAEALDISFGLNMDEHFVQNALDTLVQENLVTAARNEEGKVFYNLAEGDDAPAPKKAKGKTAASGDHFDEFVLENEAVNVVTDTIATHIDDIAHAAAPAPVPPQTAVFEASPKPVRAPAPTPPTAIFEVEDDDFAPKPKKKAKKAAPPPDIGADDDDFAPKPKKTKTKAAVFDDYDDTHDDDGGAKAKSPAAGLLAAAAAAIVLLVLAVMISASVSGGKTKTAIENAEKDLVKTLDFETFKTETDAKIAKLEAANKALETKVKKLEERAAKTQEKPAAAKKPAKRR